MNFHHYAVVFSKIKKFQLIFVFLKFFSLQINLYDLLQFLPPARLGLQNISSASRLCPTHWKYQYLKDQYLKIPMSERPISENYILKNTNIWKTSGTDLQIQICSDPPNIVRYGFRMYFFTFEFNLIQQTYIFFIQLHFLSKQRS